nr:integrase, catalytic region, zinc finger, CCHC-type, peptidase aspartic, catalytic [Tanacetum cinerariifolium]
MTNDQANYYSGITSITINEKNAYELKGKFLDDLHKNSFIGTKGEDATEHIEYFLKIVDPIDLPNVNQDKLRVVVFLISLVGDAWRCKVNTPIIKWEPNNPKFENWLASKFENYKTMDIFTKGALWCYWKLGSDEIEPTNDETFDLEETNHDDEQEISEIFRIETNLFDYETPLWKEDGYCNGGNLPGAYIVGNTLCYQDLEWYDALMDSKQKEETLRNKAIMEGMIDDNDESSNNGWRRWDNLEIADHDQKEREYENEHKDEERCELFDDHELPVCTIRRFKMIKYSSEQDEEYVYLGMKMDEVLDDVVNTIFCIKVFSIWKAFRGNTLDLGSFEEETDKTTDLHQHLSRLAARDGITSSTRCRHNPPRDGKYTILAVYHIVHYASGLSFLTAVCLIRQRLVSSGLSSSVEMAKLSEDIQCAGSDTRPPMLDRSDFASWQQCIRLYFRGKENGVNILKSIDEGPFQIGTFKETLAEGEEDKMLLIQAQENGAALDEEQFLFIADGQENVVDDDVDEQLTVFMANLSSTDPVYDEVGSSYDSDILSEVHNHDNYQDAVCELYVVHEMHDNVQLNCVVVSDVEYMSDSYMISYDQYVKNKAESVVQNIVSYVPHDASMLIINEMHE